MVGFLEIDLGTPIKSLVAVGAAGLLMACQQESRTPVADQRPRLEVVAPTTPAPEAAAVAEMERVVEEVSPSDAILNLAALLSRNARNVAYLQQLTMLTQRHLAAQLQMLAKENDPEATARAVRVLAFTDAMSRFIADNITAEGESDERAALITWALQPQQALLVAAAYDREAVQRAAAARPLTMLKDKQADILLAKLIDDPDREVSLAAMDACYDRPASREIVDALWNKTIVMGLKSMGANMGTAARPKPLVFRGRVLANDNYHLRVSQRAQDGEVATDLLLHYKSELVREHMAKLFDDLGPGQASAQTLRYLLSRNYGGLAFNATRLIQAYRPPNAIPKLLAILSATEDGREQTINGQVMRFSTRAELMGFIVAIAGLERSEYSLVQMQGGMQWAIKGGAKEESEAVEKLKRWWGANYRNFGATSAEIGPAIKLEGGSGFGRGRFRGEW
jgi:hypothetical protein